MNDRITDALDNLRVHQRQLDADGCEVGVSREALNEVIRAFGELSRRQSPAGVGVRAAAQRLLDHWDERGGPEKRGAFEGVEYWSPAGRMVDTEFIADLRSSLSVEPAGVEPVAWLVDPGTGSAMDRITTQEPLAFQYAEIIERGGSITPLYASPPPKAVAITDEMVERDKARAEAIDLLLKADDIWTDIGSGFRVHFSFSPRSSGAVIERVFTARSLTAALSSEAHNGQ